jgi:sirohydrochlorin cobaltochelatase
MPAQPGLLLVGHGTRSSRGADEFLKLADLVGGRLPGVTVEPGFLELTEPTIHQGLSRLVKRGARHVVVVPLLLFAAGHAKRDIPAAALAAASELGAEVTFSHASHLGCGAKIVQLSRQRFTESLQGRPDVPAERTCLLLVGRGSHDHSATAEMHHFARHLSAHASSRLTISVAFIAMARPAISDVLPQLAKENWQRNVVQPHLLFHGELYEELGQQVQAAAAANPEQEWILTPYLAEGIGVASPAGDLLADAILERFHDAAIRVVAPGPDR